MSYRLAASLLLLSCCTTTATATGTLRIRSTEQVASCVSAGVIEERIESPSDAAALREKVRTAVKERARKLRATDLVIIKEESEADFAYVQAEAFRCKH